MPVLIDAGTGRPQHLDALAAVLGGSPLRRVLVTHNHSDHASGAPALAARYPGVSFAKIPWPAKDPRYEVRWEPLADGDRIEAGDTALDVVATPGHAPDHACFWERESRSLFCGDLAIQGTTVVIPASAEGHLSRYLASLQRVIDLEPERLLPGHGPIIEEPVSYLRHYLAHRREREEQVLEALRSGLADPDAIARAIYRGLPAHLLPTARDSVLAHLHKLREESRARVDHGVWTVSAETT